MTRTLPPHLLYGGDYNPEQWPESVWADDVRLMREAGVNILCVGIFSWAKLQPSEKRFDFGWLDRVLDLLAANDISVCLATATASPPPWLSKKHPAILPVTSDGIVLQVGSRQQYSPSSAIYRRYAAALVTRIANRYRKHPAVVAWHLNNEYACHLHECHSEASTVAFRQWLRAKYKTLAALNAAWGTAFWSQLYGHWEEIFTPRRAPYHTNPTQCLDFKRFTSDAFLELYKMEAAILRKATPHLPLTTNFMGFFKPLDYRAWAAELDFIAWDSYPDPVDEASARHTGAAGHDLMRSLKPERPFVLMEQATSAVNWRPTNSPKRPGLMRLGSLQTVARGGDGVMFFQWRASKAGAEKFHSGLIQHIPPEQSRVFAEVKALGAELKKLTPVVGSLVRNKVAIVVDWHAWWAVETESKPGRIDYAAWAQSLHGWFYEKNIGVDFVHPDADLTGFNLVVAPALYLLTIKSAANLDSFVARGGTLLATYFTGIVDENEHVVLGGYPALLRKTLGLWVEEWAPYPDGRTNEIKFTRSRQTHACSQWCDLLHLESASAIATYSKDFFAGRPAITKNNHGQGTAYYLGTKLDSAGLDQLLTEISRQADVSAPLAAPAGVEITQRESASGKFIFALNYHDSPVKIPLGKIRGKNLITGDSVSKYLKLAPLDVAVVAVES
ncbi:beta-galactosidase [Oleiharenicola lentus]|uniref:beta-galactosidase n=1 Tax=Oleiharenicola lentus TaxID=2508720 RepID=UPI003F67161C